jgi:hypothetical protein
VNQVHARSGFAVPSAGGQVGRRAVPSDCFAPASACSVPASDDASRPARPDVRRPPEPRCVGPDGSACPH